MRTFEEIKDIIETGLGKKPCDLCLENVNLVNVFSAEIYKTNIYIKGGRIVSIDPDVKLECKEKVDCTGKYAMPGFIDTHMHFESTMLSPETLADFVVPCGTTSLFADLMEIANVAGEDGLKVMLSSIKSLPYRMLIEVPSRVPTAPGLETTGAVIDAEGVERIMQWDEAISLGELDPSKILFVKDEYLHKVEKTLARRKIVNGHAIGRLGQELNVYASSGISDDHECVNAQELLARLRVGMKVLIREGSSERNVEELIAGVLKEGLDFDNLMFCTDDKHTVDMVAEGHINYNVNRAIALGVPAIKAIQMATINAAKHFRIEDEIGSITPGRKADIILCDSIEKIVPTDVYFAGKLCAKDGKLTQSYKVAKYPDWIKDTVHLKNPITDKSFIVPSKKENGTTKVNLIELIDRQIINNWKTAELKVENGQILNDLENDVLKLAVVERYGKTGGVGIGFVKGFTLECGALAYSMSHDHHNIVVVGANDNDMAIAANVINELHGGLCVVIDGEIKAKMALPIGGLMSEGSAEEVSKELEIINDAAVLTGCKLPSPFMTLSFISLPTVPELGLTDKGLVDVINHKLIDVELD